jgi:hypothetical protein
MLKKYAEINLSKNLRKVAKSHRLSVSKLACFREWRRIAKDRRTRYVSMVNKLKKNPNSLLLLLNFTGFIIMPKEQKKTFDVLDFYSFCTLKNKFKLN